MVSPIVRALTAQQKIKIKLTQEEEIAQIKRIKASIDDINAKLAEQARRDAIGRQYQIAASFNVPQAWERCTENIKILNDSSFHEDKLVKINQLFTKAKTISCPAIKQSILAIVETCCANVEEQDAVIASAKPINQAKLQQCNDVADRVSEYLDKALPESPSARLSKEALLQESKQCYKDCVEYSTISKLCDAVFVGLATLVYSLMGALAGFALGVTLGLATGGIHTPAFVLAGTLIGAGAGAMGGYAMSRCSLDVNRFGIFASDKAKTQMAEAIAQIHATALVA